MPRKPFAAARVEAVLEAAVGQLGDDHQPAVDDFDPLERQQERMPHAANVLQRPQLVRARFSCCGPKTNLIALVSPPGASARHTSP